MYRGHLIILINDLPPLISVPEELADLIDEYEDYPKRAAQILGKINNAVSKIHTLGRIAENATFRDGELGNIFIVGGEVVGLFDSFMIPGVSEFAEFYSEAAIVVGGQLNQLILVQGKQNLRTIRNCFGGSEVPPGLGEFGYRWAKSIIKSRKGNHIYIIDAETKCLRR